MTLPQFVMANTDIENVPHAAEWINKLAKEGVTVTFDNAVQERNNYLSKKDSE